MLKKNISNKKKTDSKKGNKEILQKIDFPFTKKNYKYMFTGFLIIVFGFILMSGGGLSNPNEFYPNNNPNETPAIFSFWRITFATIVVLFGFVFEIYAIMFKDKDE